MIGFLTKYRRMLIIAVLLLIFAGGVFLLNQNMDGVRGLNVRGGTGVTTYEQARVVEVISDDTAPETQANSGLRSGTQELVVEILSGDHKGEKVNVTNPVSLFYNVYLKEGDSLIATVRDDPDNPGSFVVDVSSHNRAPVLMGLIGLFFLLLILIGGKKGLKSLLGLVFTMICVFSVFLPLVFRGTDPLLAVILIAALTSFVSLTLTGGWNRKSAAAIVGTIAGVIASGIIAALTAYLAKITLFNTSDAESLVTLSRMAPLKLNNILFSGVIIAAKGAVMDVAMSVASAVNEIHSVADNTGRKQLFKSGMNIGRDMIGTMSNTLILAFAGSSVNLLILLYAYDLPFNQLLNLDMLAIEVLQAIAGSIGIILTIPITAYITAELISHERGQV